MKKIVFTEEFCSPGNLFPFTLTRQVQDLRLGIYTIREKWEQHLQLPSFDKYENDYKDIGKVIHLNEDIGGDIVYLLHGNILPTKKLARQIKKLRHGEFLSLPDGESVAYCVSKKEIEGAHKIKVAKALESDEKIIEVKYPWEMVQLNAWALEQDFELVKANLKKTKPSSTNKLVYPSNIFIEKGATVEHCILNATEGPIFIGKGATVMEGTLIRGPVAICEGAVVKMGTRIYGATTIGPFCTVGGEIKNSIFMEYSNKAHDGYIGDSVIGAWCNLGAGTSNSNLKNNASEIIIWTPAGPRKVGQKCGVLMGDYSRTAINTSINTGTVIGACSNVFGSGLSPKYIPSFSWGYDGVERYELQKCFEDIHRWKEFKGSHITDNEKNILKHIFDHY